MDLNLSGGRNREEEENTDTQSLSRMLYKWYVFDSKSWKALMDSEVEAIASQ